MTTNDDQNFQALAACMKVGFIGTGLMGGPMARKLIEAGHTVRVWNRTPGKAEALRASGAQVAVDLHDVARDVDLIIAVIENGAAVRDVLFNRGLARSLQRGQVIVDMSSIALADAIDIHGQLAALGSRYVDAPISGGPDGAAAGTLAIMAGGDASAVEFARPALECMGRLTYVGPAGAGQTAKLLNQTISSTAILAVSEVMVLAQRLGLDPACIRAALAGGFADSRILQIHGKRMTDRNFQPGGHVRTFLKDLNNAANLIAAHGLVLPAADLARSYFTELVAAGYGEDDISSMILLTESRNSIKPPDASKV